MCGRYTLTAPGEVIADVFGLETAPELAPRYNIAPGQDAPVVRQEAGRRRLDAMRWGLVPSWASDPAVGNKSINARAESVAEKPSFRDSFLGRRCLVPADGFYEWRAEGARRKTPYHLRPARSGVIAFAGLWDVWRSAPEAPPLWTYTIVTTDASEDLRDLHDRMPVVLQPSDWARWLDAAAAPSELRALLRPAASGFFLPRAVGDRVSSVANDDPACLDPATGPRQLSLLG
jgi:putative SOS response-associated peptidase YedK